MRAREGHNSAARIGPPWGKFGWVDICLRTPRAFLSTRRPSMRPGIRSGSWLSSEPGSRRDSAGSGQRALGPICATASKYHHLEPDGDLSMAVGKEVTLLTEYPKIGTGILMGRLLEKTDQGDLIIHSYVMDEPITTLKDEAVLLTLER